MQVTGTTPVIDSHDPPSTVNEGQTFNLGPVDFHDPDTNETHTATVVWGDGNSDSNAQVTEPTDANGSPVDGTMTDSYSYAVPGTYTRQCHRDQFRGRSPPPKPSRSTSWRRTSRSIPSPSDGTNLDVTYTVSGADADAFNIDIYTSADGTTPGQLLMPYPVTVARDLAVGTQSVTIAPVFADIPSAYHLIAVSDANGTNSDGTLVDPPVEFEGGVFAATDNTQTSPETVAYVFTPPGEGNQAVSIYNVGAATYVNLNGANYDISSMTTAVSAIHVRTEEPQGTATRSTPRSPFAAGMFLSGLGRHAALVDLWRRRATTPSPAGTAATRSSAAADRTSSTTATAGTARKSSITATRKRPSRAWQTSTSTTAHWTAPKPRGGVQQRAAGLRGRRRRQRRGRLDV